MKTVSMVVKNIMTMISGVVFGASLLFIALLGSLAVAFAAQVSFRIPGVILVNAAKMNNAPAIEFMPNWIGCGIVVAAIAVAYFVFVKKRQALAPKTA